MHSNDARSVLAGYVRARLKKEEAEHGRGYQAEVARKTGLSTAHVANVMNRPHQGVGTDALIAFAGFWGMTLGQLEDAAREWAKDLPPPPEHEPLPPNLTEALEFMRSRRTLPEELVAKARRVAAAGGDFSVPVWIAMLHDLIEMQGAKATPSPPAPRKRSAPGR